MPIYEIKSFRGALSDYEDKGIEGAFKFGHGLDVRKRKDTLSCQQALIDEGLDESVITPALPPVSLLGDTSPVQAVGISANTLIFQKFTANRTGSMSSFRLKANYGGNVKVAIYNDSAGTPSALLNSVGTTPVLTGINIITFPPTNITAGVDYWLAYNFDADTLVSVAASGGTSLSVLSVPFANSFPGTYPGGGFVQVHNHAIAGWGPETITSPSASLSPSASTSSSISLSKSPSASPSPSAGAGSSTSPSASLSPSVSLSPSASVSPTSSVSPSPSPSAGLLTTFVDLIHFFVKCSDKNTYGFGDTGYVYKRTPAGDWSAVYNAGRAILGAEEGPASNGKTYLYFATNTELHRKEIPGNTAWNDVNQIVPGTADPGWPKQNLTVADWHTMTVVGGATYIANADKLAMVGYDQSYTNEALDLIPGNLSRTLVERNGRVIIGTARAADPTKGVNGAIDSEVPLAQVGDDGEIFYANMIDSMPVKRFPGGGKVNPGGVANEVDQVNFFEWEQDALSWLDKQSVGNMALFGVWDADTGTNGVYTFGRKNKNHPFVLNLEYLLEVDEIGAVTNMNGITLVSYRDGSDYGVKAVDLTRKATGVYEGIDYKSPIKKAVEITQWKHAELFMAPLPVGASVEFWYKVNKTGDFIQAKTAGSGANSYTTYGGKKAVFRIGVEGEIFEPKVVLNPIGNETPEIHRIRVAFQ